MTLERDPDLELAISLAREQAIDVPNAAHREQVRTELLARAQLVATAPSATRRYAAIAPVLAAAAAMTVYVGTRGSTAEPERGTWPGVPRLVAHGHVHARTGAQLDVVTLAPDEVVRVHEGTVDVEVDRLGPGERFRVVVGASEVEVRGTAFSVTAEHDRLIDVQVVHGRVEVRPSGGVMTVLEGGGGWHVAAPVAPVAPIAPVAQKPSTRASTSPTAPERLTVPADQRAYDEGWTALRAQQFGEAAMAFGRSLAGAPEGALADDARFWHAVALARGERAADAIIAFRDLVDQHPGSTHTGEAAAMLGWLLVDAKQLAEARTRFVTAQNDPSEKVRASASAGLAALDHPVRP